MYLSLFVAYKNPVQSLSSDLHILVQYFPEPTEIANITQFEEIGVVKKVASLFGKFNELVSERRVQRIGKKQI